MKEILAARLLTKLSTPPIGSLFDCSDKMGSGLELLHFYSIF